LQLVASAHFNPPEQARAEAAEQVPAPSHVRAGVYELVLVHDAVPQDVPDAAIRHAPAPLQEPSRSQGLVESLAHSLSGSWPAGTDAHLPFG